MSESGLHLPSRAILRSRHCARGFQRKAGLSVCCVGYATATHSTQVEGLPC